MRRRPKQRPPASSAGRPSPNQSAPGRDQKNLGRLGRQGHRRPEPHPRSRRRHAARAIDPQILTKLSQDLTRGSVVITGTNGKTTTARLVTWLLEGAGHRVVSNRAGANLIFGATAAALNKAGL